MTDTKQPLWQFLANLCDASPIKHGGAFVYIDQTGVYVPEVELLIQPPDEIEIDSAQARWEVRRFCIEPCTLQNGILSDNKYHPEHPAWFADTAEQIANFSGQSVFDFRDSICNGGVIDRARCWLDIGSYHGFENLDQYPNFYTLNEVRARYTVELAGSSYVRRRVWE